MKLANLSESEKEIELITLEPAKAASIARDRSRSKKPWSKAKIKLEMFVHKRTEAASSIEESEIISNLNLEQQDKKQRSKVSSHKNSHGIATRLICPCVYYIYMYMAFQILCIVCVLFGNYNNNNKILIAAHNLFYKMQNMHIFLY